MSNNLSYINAKTLTSNITNLFKKLKYLTPSLLISLLPILLPATATAIPSIPPESCFDYTTADGEVTITDYYDHEANNNSNPACTRELIIPSTIGGNPVTTIGDSAFSNSHLIGLTISNSVTSIGGDAFRENQLTDLTIPNYVTTIGDSAFSHNQLTNLMLGNSLISIGAEAFEFNFLKEVNVPDSVTTVGDMAFWINSIDVVTISQSVTSIGALSFEFQLTNAARDAHTAYYFDGSPTPENGQIMLNGIKIPNIYASPSQVTALSLADSVLTEADMGPDLNADGDQTDIISGHLINPSRVTANYKDNNGNTIAPSTIATGTGLSSYLAVDNPTNNLSLYYRVGNSYTVPPAPTITGYTIQTTPSNIASLTAGNNSIDYIYTANSNNNNNEEGNNNSNTVGLTTPTSPISAFSLRPVSISTPTGTNISSSSTVPESSLVTQDNDNQYPLGLVNFSFTTNQTNNQVTLDFITNLTPNQVTPRKYNPNSKTYTNLPSSANPTITETTIDNKHALTLTYTLIDNGELDLDPTTGIVKDPIGLAVSNQTYDQLANTGANNTLPMVIALAMITLVGGIGLASKRGRVWV